MIQAKRRLELSTIWATLGLTINLAGIVIFLWSGMMTERACWMFFLAMLFAFMGVARGETAKNFKAVVSIVCFIPIYIALCRVIWIFLAGLL